MVLAERANHLLPLRNAVESYAGPTELPFQIVSIRRPRNSVGHGADK
jgi:hypothetical protein